MLEAAAKLAQTIDANFRDPERGGFFQTSDDHDARRRKDFIDSAIPSGNSLAAELFPAPEPPAGPAGGRGGCGVGIMAVMADAMSQQPGAFGRLLCALELYLHPGWKSRWSGPGCRGDAAPAGGGVRASCPTASSLRRAGRRGNWRANFGWPPAWWAAAPRPTSAATTSATCPSPSLPTSRQLEG